MLTPKSPRIHRIIGYLQERFPPGPYTVLVALFFGSAVWVAQGLTAAPSIPNPYVWLGAPVLWLVFFHLRVFDEHKDHRHDQNAYPDRLLSRGVVTLTLLTRLGMAAVLLQMVLSAWIGQTAVLAWTVTFGFTVAMRMEFGIGGWLNRHLLLYAITHNPVVGLLAVYAWACTGLAFANGFGLYIAAVSLGSLAFEMGRKLRLPSEEIPGVASYSSVLGRGRAGVLLMGVIIAAALCALGVTWMVGEGWGSVIGGVVVVLGALMGCIPCGSKPAKAVENGSSIALLSSMLGMAIAALG